MHWILMFCVWHADGDFSRTALSQHDTRAACVEAIEPTLADAADFYPGARIAAWCRPVTDAHVGV